MLKFKRKGVCMQVSSRSVICAMLGLGFLSHERVFAAESVEAAGWRYHGVTRAAMGLVDSSSKSGLNFSLVDVFFNFSAATSSYSAVSELELVYQKISSEEEKALIGLRRGFVAYKAASAGFEVQSGRLLLSGVRRLGTEAATRRNDETLGRMDGIRFEYGADRSPLHLGFAFGNTLGTYGASSTMAESTMEISFRDPASSNPPKASRAMAASLASCFSELCLEARYLQENDYFSAAPTITRDETTLGKGPDGIVYERFQYFEGGVHGVLQAISVGAWFSKSWLKNPSYGALDATGNDIVKGKQNAGNSNWLEIASLGLEYAFSSASAEAPGVPFLGLTLSARRAGTDALASDSAQAIREDAQDLKEIGVSAGWKEGPALLSLTAIHDRAAGDVFSTKKGTAESKDQRTVVYSAFTFSM